MSWALLEWRPQAPGLEVTHTLISNCRFAKKAHMGQSKVNVPVRDGKKRFFRATNSQHPGKAAVFRGCWVRFNEGERVDSVFKRSMPSDLIRGVDTGSPGKRVKQKEP
jgi:hypothetical protein